MRIATVNIASGRGGPDGGPGAGGMTPTAAQRTELATAFAELDADVVCVQELDSAQPRSGRADQPARLAEVIGATDWRAAATLAGTPGPRSGWRPLDPPRLRGPADPSPTGPEYGIALFSRRPVRRWHAHGLPAGRAVLPIQVTEPGSGRSALWWFPDEPRAALAAELAGLTVLGTHLSFSPPTAVRQLRTLRTWASTLPGPVLLVGDLNLPGPLPALLTGGRRLTSAASYPAAAPRVQLDHLLGLDGLTGRDPVARRLPVGDHLALAVTVVPPIVADR